jgi:hypothetical protein
MPAALSLNSSASQRVQKYCAVSSTGAEARFAGLRRLRYSARRTMFSINDRVVRNLILFMRWRSEAAYIHLKPEENDKL